jgi:hypothetical protein
MCGIAINTSSLQGHSEIDISGKVADFTRFAKQLPDLSSGVVSLRQEPSPYFPMSMSQVIVEPVSQSEGLLTARIEGAGLRLSGDGQAFRKLADFLESLSTLSPGAHFHLDWFANDDWLAPATATMSFIFSLKA